MRQIVRYHKKIIFLASKNHSFHVTPRDKSKPKILRKAQSPNLTFPSQKNFSKQKNNSQNKKQQKKQQKRIEFEIYCFV